MKTARPFLLLSTISLSSGFLSPTVPLSLRCVRKTTSGASLRSAQRGVVSLSGSSNQEWIKEGMEKGIDYADSQIEKAVSTFAEAGPEEAQLVRACALANRGQDATLEEKDMVEDAARTLEDMNQKFNATRMNGEWQLLYCSESITRSSPFFWAFRKATSDFRQPFPLLPPALSEALFLITDGIPFASAGKSMQMISGLSEQNAGEMVSSVQVKLRVFDAIIPPNVGYVTTTCRLSVMNDGAFGDLKLSVLTTEVKDSTWGQLPVVGGIFESSRFPSGEALEAVKAGSSSVDMKVTYMSNTLKITRNLDGQLFVHARVA